MAFLLTNMVDLCLLEVMTVILVPWSSCFIVWWVQDQNKLRST